MTTQALPTIDNSITRTILQSSYLKGRIGWQGLRASEFIEEGPFLVTGTDFINGRIDWKRCYHISEERYQEAPYIHLREGDLLITKDGTIGKTALVKNCPEKAVLNSGVFLIRCKDGSYLHEYLFYLLNSEHFKSFLEDAKGGSTIVHLYQREFEKYTFTLPDIQIQKRKVRILSTVDEAIEQTEALIAKYNRIRTGLMQDLLSARITEWPQHPLGQLADVASGITLGKKHNGPDTVERPYLRVANVQDGYLNLSDVTYIRLPKSQVERYELRDGDVLMNEGGDFDKLGRGTVWRNEIAGCLHQNHVFRVRCQQDRLLPDFLALVSASPYGKRFFVLNSKQSTNLASINSTQLKSFPIPLPDIEEQRRLVGIFAQKTLAIQMHQQQLAKLQTLKKGLMQDLLAGPSKSE